MAGAQHGAPVRGPARLPDAAVPRMRAAGHPAPCLKLAQRTGQLGGDARSGC